MDFFNSMTATRVLLKREEPDRKRMLIRSPDGAA
jgi:hypothetical protein